MEIRQLLVKQGYELDNEEQTPEGRREVWINRATRRGVLVEWFKMVEVKA